jgi:starvation-inducible outer membrane lipoprotein
MRNIILLALMAAVLAGCATSPQSQEEYAATINADKRVWPPYDPNSAFPDQIMDGKN